MKYTANFVLSILALLVMASCQDDFLEKQPLDQISEASSLSDLYFYI